MEKKCIICGRQLSEEQMVCSFCGSGQDLVMEVPASPEPAAPAKAVSPTAPEEAAQPQKRRLSPWLLCFAGFAAALLVFLGVSYIKGLPTGPEDALARYEALLNGDAEQVEALLPESYWLYYEENWDRTREELIEGIMTLIEKNKVGYYYGDDLASSTLIPRPITEYRLALLEETETDPDLAETFVQAMTDQNIGAEDVKAIRTLTVWEQCCYDMDGTAQSSNSIKTLYAAQIGSDWYLFQGYSAISTTTVLFLPTMYRLDSTLPTG